MQLQGGRMDKLSPRRRSWNMSRIKGRDTSPENRTKDYLNARLSLPASSLRFAGKTRYRLRKSTEGDFRERLLLARPWLPPWKTSVERPRILGREDRRESKAGSSQCSCAEEEELAGADCLAMPIEEFGEG